MCISIVESGNVSGPLEYNSVTRPDVEGGHTGLGGLARRLELGLDDGRLTQGDGVGRGDGVARGLLGRCSRCFQRRRQVARPLFGHLIVTRVKEFLLELKYYVKVLFTF